MAEMDRAFVLGGGFGFLKRIRAAISRMAILSQLKGRWRIWKAPVPVNSTRLDDLRCLNGANRE